MMKMNTLCLGGAHEGGVVRKGRVTAYIPHVAFGGTIRNHSHNTDLEGQLVVSI